MGGRIGIISCNRPIVPHKPVVSRGYGNENTHTSSVSRHEGVFVWGRYHGEVCVLKIHGNDRILKNWNIHKKSICICAKQSRIFCISIKQVGERDHSGNISAVLINNKQHQNPGWAHGMISHHTLQYNLVFIARNRGSEVWLITSFLWIWIWIWILHWAIEWVALCPLASFFRIHFSSNLIWTAWYLTRHSARKQREHTYCLCSTPGSLRTKTPVSQSLVQEKKSASSIVYL